MDDERDTYKQVRVDAAYLATSARVLPLDVLYERMTELLDRQAAIAADECAMNTLCLDVGDYEQVRVFGMTLAEVNDMRRENLNLKESLRFIAKTVKGVDAQ